jgi:hypothetical protein
MWFECSQSSPDGLARRPYRRFQRTKWHTLAPSPRGDGTGQNSRTFRTGLANFQFHGFLQTFPWRLPSPVASKVSVPVLSPPLRQYSSSATSATDSDQVVTLADTGKQVRIVGITEDYGFLRTVPLENPDAPAIILSPDGNSFDMLHNLIRRVE